MHLLGREIRGTLHGRSSRSQHNSSGYPCPRQGGEQLLHTCFDYDALEVHRALTAMEKPTPGAWLATGQTLAIRHPGGVGDILHSADGGSWLAGSIEQADSAKQAFLDPKNSSELSVVALA